MADAVGGALLSAFLQVLVDRMASREIVDFLGRRKLDGRPLKKLNIALLSVNVLLDDAEEKQVTNPNVKRWVDELKNVVYDAEDILDEIATKTLRRKLDAEFETTARTVRNSIYVPFFVNNIEAKIKEILNSLEYLVNQKDVLGLREGVGWKPSEILPTTSLVEESNICGRNEDKEEIIRKLFSDDASGNEVGVIALVGMGGIGKTTLAQLVYNDKTVREHFNGLQAWVCVSEEFDLIKLTKRTLEAITLSTCDIMDLNRLQVLLKEKLMGKRFLLVLDNVWNKNYDFWEVFSNPFKYGAQGSKIIVTTRDDGVASVMKARAIHHVKKLPDEDCWLLFAKHAFHNDNSNAYPKLEEIGRKILKKCEGLPLAAKAIGALLRSKLDVDEWDKVLNSKLWDLPIQETNILPALRLSYKYLPPYLKRCFSYCSIFPKDYDFKKRELVLLWMAEGFLHETQSKTMEEIGDDYFDALVSRSLFQQSSGKQSYFGMHDLINDLAKFVSGEFSFRLEVDRSQEIVNKTRHFSYVRTIYDTFNKFEALHETKQLRTFLPLELSPRYFYFWLTRKVASDLLPILRCLQVLSLSHYKNMTELPESIGKIKHLRYLDISFTAVTRLPDSICKLCNLQTLKLSNCKDLTELPRDMQKLINLRHLDISGTHITQMPVNLGRLKFLQTLTTFIVSRRGGCSIGELGKLANLQGTLSILELQNVESSRDALDARLNSKTYLEELVLEWNALNADISEIQKTVLDSLQPHTNLKSLTIQNYGCKRFPDWVGHHSFSNITSLGLRNSRYCCCLPPFWELPSLQNLSIIGFDGIVTVGPEFYGSSSSIKPFGALKLLRFEEMLNWEEWIPFGAENEGHAFPHLEELYIANCLKLTGGLPIHLPSLAKLEIIGCPQLVASLPRAPSLREMELRNCNEVLLQELPIGMEKLKVEGFDALESLPEVLMDSNSHLQKLQICLCSSLLSLIPGGLPSTLKALESLEVDNCDSLKSIPLNLFPNLKEVQISFCKNLESLAVPEHDLVALSSIDIDDCPNFVCFPKGGLHAPNLTLLWMHNCKSLRSLPDMMHILLPSLTYLSISACPEIESFPKEGLPSHLKYIAIVNSYKLIANRMGLSLPKYPYLKSLTIGGQSEDVVSFPEEGLLPTNLTILELAGFPNLKWLERKGFQHLTSLETLWIYDCPQLKCMPEDGLPASLSILDISGCPLLEKQLQKRKGKEWRKIARVPRIVIGQDLIE